jgi:hypothetical protein
MSNEQQRAELAELMGQMNAQQRSVFIYLGRLYLERHAAPSRSLDRKIERIQGEIERGGIPSVPSDH